MSLFIRLRGGFHTRKTIEIEQMALKNIIPDHFLEIGLYLCLSEIYTLYRNGKLEKDLATEMKRNAFISYEEECKKLILEHDKLNKTVMYKGVQYELSGFILRKGEEGYFYQAELKKDNHIIIARCEDVT